MSAVQTIEGGDKDVRVSGVEFELTFNSETQETGGAPDSQILAAKQKLCSANLDH